MFISINRWTFITSKQCCEWFRRLIEATSSSKPTESVFAFALYAWVSEEGGEELIDIISKKTTATNTEAFYTEVCCRMRILQCCSITFFKLWPFRFQ